MPLTQLPLYDSDGRFHSDISDAIDKGVQALVTNVVETIISPTPINRISQILLIDTITSRLESRLIADVTFRNSQVGQGSSNITTKTPLEILEDDIDTAFAKSERGQWDGELAHDMLQTFSRMLADAKKGQSYFKDWDEDEDDDEPYNVHTEGDGEYPYGANAR